MSKNIEISSFPDLGRMVPTDEIKAKKIDINQFWRPTYKETVIAILEHIIDYNSKFVSEEDRAYRITYEVRTANGYYQPNFEKLNDDKTCLILSVNGESLKRKTILEIIDVNQIIGIGSDSFDLLEFDTTTTAQNKLKLTSQDNYNTINKMLADWTNLKTDDYNYIMRFKKDLETMNDMNFYNRREVYKIKRSYVHMFLFFLESKIKDPKSLDGSVSLEQIQELYKKFGIASQELDY